MNLNEGDSLVNREEAALTLELFNCFLNAIEEIAKSKETGSEVAETIAQIRDFKEHK